MNPYTLTDPFRWLWSRVTGRFDYLPAVSVVNFDPMDFLACSVTDGFGSAMVRTDLGAYIASYSVRVNPTTAWQFMIERPFTGYIPGRGDGGQEAVVGPDHYVRFTRTRDGGTPTMQWFAGGTGWVVFGADAAPGAWREVVAYLSDVPDPSQPGSLNTAFTRYRREQCVVGKLSHDCVVSEHYDNSSISAAQNMERSYFALGVGLLRWEAWGKSAPSPDFVAQLPVRNSYASFSGPPASGWSMYDVRSWEGIEAIPLQPVPVFS